MMTTAKLEEGSANYVSFRPSGCYPSKPYINKSEWIAGTLQQVTYFVIQEEIGTALENGRQCNREIFIR